MASVRRWGVLFALVAGLTMAAFGSQTFQQAIQVCLQYLGLTGRHKRLTVEPIQGITETGDLATDEALLRTSGDTTGLSAGGAMPVLWTRASMAPGARGVKPAVVLAHHAKQMQPSPPVLAGAGPGVEELFIDAAGSSTGSSGEGTNDVFLRTRNFVARLNVRSALGLPVRPTDDFTDALTRVIWGNDGRSFAVGIGRIPFTIYGPGDWGIFELSQRPSPHQTWSVAPNARLLRREQVDMSWIGDSVQINGLVLDSARDLLYGVAKGEAPDPRNFYSAALVNQTQRKILRSFGMLAGPEGAFATVHIGYADGATLDRSVIVVQTGSLESNIGGESVESAVKVAVWVGNEERVLHSQGAGSVRFRLGNFARRSSTYPIWPQSTRRRLLYTISAGTGRFLVNGSGYFESRLYDVLTQQSRVISRDDYGPGNYGLPNWSRLTPYDLRGSSSTDADRLFQAGRFAEPDHTTALPGNQIEQFVKAWNGNALTLIVDGPFPVMDTAVAALAALTPYPAGTGPTTAQFSHGATGVGIFANWIRAIQVIE